MNKKLFSFRLSEKLMEDVRESATAEGVSVTKLVETVLERHLQQKHHASQEDVSVNQTVATNQAVESNVNRPRSIDASLLRDLLLEILFDPGAARGTSQRQTQESQDLKELKEQVKNLDGMVRALLKENLRDANPLSDYSKCNT